MSGIVYDTGGGSRSFTSIANVDLNGKVSSSFAIKKSSNDFYSEYIKINGKLITTTLPDDDQTAPTNGCTFSIGGDFYIFNSPTTIQPNGTTRGVCGIGTATVATGDILSVYGGNIYNNSILINRGAIGIGPDASTTTIGTNMLYINGNGSCTGTFTVGNIGLTNLVIPGYAGIGTATYSTANTVGIYHPTTIHNTSLIVYNSTNSTTISNTTATSATALNDPQNVLRLHRNGTSAQSGPASVYLALSRWENQNWHSRTRLDIRLGHTYDAHDGDHTTPMIIYSDGRIQIGPYTTLTNGLLDFCNPGWYTTGAIRFGIGDWQTYEGGRIEMQATQWGATPAVRIRYYSAGWGATGGHYFDGGCMGIGKLPDSNYRLDVNGNIRSSGTIFGTVDYANTAGNTNYANSCDYAARMVTGPWNILSEPRILYYYNGAAVMRIQGYSYTYSNGVSSYWAELDTNYIRATRGLIIDSWTFTEETNDDLLVMYGGGIKSKFSINGNGAYVNFTGQHRTISENKKIYETDKYNGYIVSSQKKYKNLNSIYGKNNIKQNITLLDALPYVDLSSNINDKNVFGVIYMNESYVNRTDNTREYQATPGIINILDKNIDDNRIIINSIGEGSILVSDYNGILEGGDYITTSPIRGIGMKQNDDLMHNYTVAKITMDCDFNPKYIPVEIIKTSNIIKSLETSNIYLNYTSNYSINYTSNYDIYYASNYSINYTSNYDINYTSNYFINHTSNYYITYSSNYSINYTSNYSILTNIDDEIIKKNKIDIKYEDLVINYYNCNISTPLYYDNGNIIYENVLDINSNIVYDYEYEMKYIYLDGTITTKEDWEINHLTSNIYRMAFVGCTYHCG